MRAVVFSSTAALSELCSIAEKHHKRFSHYKCVQAIFFQSSQLGHSTRVRRKKGLTQIVDRRAPQIPDDLLAGPLDARLSMRVAADRMLRS
jgi:hypothetical protein